MSEIPEERSNNSVTMLFTAKVSRKDSAKSSENVLSEDVASVGKIVRNDKSLNPKKFESNAFAMKPPKKAPLVIDGSHIPIAKTTRTYELRRKAGEEMARERAAKALAEKLAAVPLPPPEKPQKSESERKIPTAVKKTAAASPPPRVPPARKYLPSSTTRPLASSSAMRRLHDMLYPHDRIAAQTRSVEVQTCSDVAEMLSMREAKIMTPSPKLWADILKKREQDLKDAMLKEVREVPEHSKDEVNFQTNLKEFLETGTVKRYERKAKGDERKDVFKRSTERPKVRTETDLKKRLKTIEGELMDVFKPST